MKLCVPEILWDFYLWTSGPKDKLVQAWNSQIKGLWILHRTFWTRF